jgi:transposase InsO family protein
MALFRTKAVLEGLIASLRPRSSHRGRDRKQPRRLPARVDDRRPIKITKILTDNGSQITDRFSMKDKTPSGQHAFDKVCAGMDIEHRLAPPRHPQPNGMMEPFERPHQRTFEAAWVRQAGWSRNYLLNY